jgi:YhcH/YjgK/YiaL family protein
MIKDNIKNAKNYYNLSQNIKIGLKHLENTDFSSLKNGKYSIKSDEVYAIVQDYHSKPIEEGKFEAHKKYTDIQFIIKGEEKIGIGNLNDFSSCCEYDSEKDIIFFEQNNTEFITLNENEFAIFTPQDAHMPSIAITNPDYVKKVVIKVKSKR